MSSIDDSLRQVTALSFDLVDSTSLLGQVGCESYSQVLTEFHACCTSIITRHGGVPDDPQGDDGVMCYFGFPVATEGSAYQAVNAGLAMVEAVTRLGLRVRVGIATGRVAVKSGQPVGLAVHFAARLQTVAEPNSVIVSEATRRLVEPYIDLRRLGGDVSLKGIEEPQSLYRAIRLRTDDSDASRRLPRLTPFVGREAELDMLARSWDVASSGKRQVVVVSGEAGIGKSRLLREFRRHIQARGQRVIEYRCNSSASASAFNALIGPLRDYLKLQSHDDHQVRMQKIARGMPAEIFAADAAAVELVASLFSPSHDPPIAEPALAPERLRERTLAVLLAWFRAVAMRSPVCLMVDDVHWIDPSTREFLVRLVSEAQASPLFVLIAMRTETDTEWRPDCSYGSIVLRGLQPTDAAVLVNQACGEVVLPKDVVRHLVLRGDGVPLFLEESARMAAEFDGVGAAGAQAWRMEVPATIDDLLMARLDRVGPAKAMAQLGAVLGREFQASLLEALLAHGNGPPKIGDPQHDLDALLASGLLLRIAVGREVHYRFKHALIRDAAYLSLWERDRKSLHEQVASVLSESFVDLVRQQPEVLAYHLTEAGLYTRALDAWEGAARLAATRSAHREAIDLATRALALVENVPSGPARDRAELRLQMLLASRLIATEGYGAPRVERVYLRASDLCDGLGDAAARLKVDLGLEAYFFMRADFRRAQEIALRVAKAAEGSSNAMLALQAEWALANVLWHQGDLPAAMQHMDRCLRSYRPEMHRPAAVQDPGVMCLCYSAWAQWELGYAGDAAARVQRVLALAHRLDHRFSLGEAYGFAASVHHFRGETDIALGYAEQAVTICEEGGFVVWLAHALMMRGRLLAEKGDVDAGLVEMERGYALWIQTGAVVTRPLYLALRAEGLLIAGRNAQAAELLEQALQVANCNGEYYHKAEILRLLGESTLRTANAGEEAAMAQAERYLSDSLELANRQQKPAFALRSAMGLARVYVDGGRRGEAAQLLRAAMAAMPDAQDTRDWQRAARMLAELPPVAAMS